MNIDIGRMNISLHGISAEVVEESTAGLEEELRRRLGTRMQGQGLNSKTANIDLAELALSPVHVSTTLNAAGLRSLIADRLVEAIEAQQLASESTELGGDV